MNINEVPAVRRRSPRGQGKSKVIEAASGLFAEQGVSGTSLREIADRMGVTKAAVYHQFASKEEIVLAVAEPVIARLQAIADHADSLSPGPALTATVEGLVDLALAERGTAAVIRRDPVMARILDSHVPYSLQIARIDAHLLGHDPSVERRVAMAFAGGGIMALGALPDFDVLPEQLRAGLVSAMIRALAV
ncbi:TetR/AcrR family transcriptional regulator [Arthrobacter sp. GMC3]|uniref:TetR/AcrR family transcriptional regulator n=1 Tax=Arthrobacter sp. GMC3 TaxID=2058894 RepID=UPI000CE55B64|nr:TetR/AcrR family transcriptional regulator [Arthrobacter sp. GMC3]